MIPLLAIYISVATNMASSVSVSTISSLSTLAALIVISNEEAYERHRRRPWNQSVGGDPCYRVEGGDYGSATTTTTSTSTDSCNNSGLKSMAVDYKYGLRIISPPNNGGVGVVGVVRGGE